MAVYRCGNVHCPLHGRDQAKRANGACPECGWMLRLEGEAPEPEPLNPLAELDLALLGLTTDAKLATESLQEALTLVVELAADCPDPMYSLEMLARVEKFTTETRRKLGVADG